MPDSYEQDVDVLTARMSHPVRMNRARSYSKAIEERWLSFYQVVARLQTIEGNHAQHDLIKCDSLVIDVWLRPKLNSGSLRFTNWITEVGLLNDFHLLKFQVYAFFSNARHHRKTDSPADQNRRGAKRVIKLRKLANKRMNKNVTTNEIKKIWNLSCMCSFTYAGRVPFKFRKRWVCEYYCAACAFDVNRNLEFQMNGRLLCHSPHQLVSYRSVPFDFTYILWSGDHRRGDKANSLHLFSFFFSLTDTNDCRYRPLDDWAFGRHKLWDGMIYSMAAMDPHFTQYRIEHLWRTMCPLWRCAFHLQHYL